MVRGGKQGWDLMSRQDDGGPIVREAREDRGEIVRVSRCYPAIRFVSEQAGWSPNEYGRQLGSATLAP
jgi:hypothetical protein